MINTSSIITLTTVIREKKKQMELQQTIINIRGQFLGLFLSDQQFNEHIKFRIGVSHKLAAVSHVRHTGIMESLRFLFRKVTKTEINY